MVFFVSRPLSFASLTYPLSALPPEEDVEKLFTEDKTTASWSEKIENQKGDIFAPQHHSILTLILSVIQRKTHALSRMISMIQHSRTPWLRDSLRSWSGTSQVVPWKRWRIRYHWKQQKKTLFFFTDVLVFLFWKRRRLVFLAGWFFFMLDGSKMMIFGIQMQYTYVFKLVWVWWYILYIQSYKGVFLSAFLKQKHIRRIAISTNPKPWSLKSFGPNIMPHRIHGRNGIF